MKALAGNDGCEGVGGRREASGEGDEEVGVGVEHFCPVRRLRLVMCYDMTRMTGGGKPEWKGTQWCIWVLSDYCLLVCQLRRSLGHQAT
jgi:hypothetical protein